jgi:hypothetical protein
LGKEGLGFVPRGLKGRKAEMRDATRGAYKIKRGMKIPEVEVLRGF